MSGIKAIINNSSSLHGGIVSYVITVPLYKLLGTLGCYISYFAIYVISIIVILDITIMDVINRFKEKRLQANNKKKQDSPIINDNIEANSIAEDDEKSSYINNINKKIKIIDFMKNVNVEEPASTIVENNTQKNDKLSKEDSHEQLSKDISEEIVINSTESDNKVYNFPPLDLLNVNNISNMNKDDKKDLLNMQQIRRYIK